MRHTTVVAILILSFLGAAYSQQPSTTRRRGLDQLDLLTLRSNGNTPSVGGPIVVDVETFQLLEPLARYCRQLESSYKAEIMAKPGPLTFPAFEDVFKEKAIAIHRSIVLIRKIREISPQVSKLLDQTNDFGKDVSLVILALQFPSEREAEFDLRSVREKYGASDSTEHKELIAVILGRMNANFARLQVGQ